MQGELRNLRVVDRGGQNNIFISNFIGVRLRHGGFRDLWSFGRDEFIERHDTENREMSMKPRELPLKFRRSGEYIVTMASGNKNVVDCCKIRGRRGIMVGGGTC